MQWSEFSFILKPSTLGGIGVFATHDLPPATLVFNSSYTTRTMKIKDVPAEMLKYCIYINDEEVIAPERFDRMEIGWFINHSSDPNIIKGVLIDDGVKKTVVKTDDSKIRSVFTIKEIKAGDEILIDYNTLNEPEHLKESYFKN